MYLRFVNLVRLGVESVRDTVQGHNDISLVFGVLLYADATWDVPWATSLSSKVEGFSDSHHGEVDINLCSVDGFAAVVLVHEFWADTCSQRE